MNKVEQLLELQSWLKSKYSISLDEFDIRLKQQGLALKQLLIDYERAYNDGFKLPLVNYIITADYEEALINK